MLKIINNLVQVELPRVLYKYRNWKDEFHKSILRDNMLYMASPRDFSDEKDCHLSEKYPETERDVYEFMLKIYNKEEHGSFDQYKRYCKSNIKNSPLLNKTELDEIVFNLECEYDETHGILSMTEDSDNKYLWENYANNYAGICVGFDTEILCAINNGISGGGAVTYYKQLPYIDISRDSIEKQFEKKIFSKDSMYAKEKEYRFIKSGIKNENQRKLIFPNNAILKIIIGNALENNAKNEIKDLVKSKFNKAEIIEL
ncbi:MAG: DUF2971 domain-containing protein [Bacteroidales bacterium]|nr:DUF2971 domain-containing protein [Bacteroidales bacterium]